MASSYSPLLRLELIGAGEQSGLWGDTTNKNLGTLIDQAVAGVSDIPLSGGAGTYEVRALDGTRDEARSAVLKFTGSPSGVKTIQIPSSEKLYVVRNDSTQTITVKTSAQIANPVLGGVPLLPSEATLVFCDGTIALKGIQAEGVGVLGVAGGGTGRDNFSTAGFLKTPGGQGGFTSVANIALDSADTSGILPTSKGGTGGTLPASNGGTGITSSGTAGNGLISTGAGWQSTATVNSITGGPGISVTGTAGNFTISTSGGAGVTSVNGQTGAVTVSTASIGAYPTSNPAGYVTSSALTGFASLNSVNTFGSTNNYTTGASISVQGPTFDGQRIAVNFAGFSTGIHPTGIQISGSGAGLIRSTINNRLDIVNSGLSAYFQTDGNNLQGNNSPNWASISDQNIKTNLRPISSVLDKMNALKPCHFEYKDKIGETRTGFIAQEFATVFPGHTLKSAVDEKYKEFMPEGVTELTAIDINLTAYLVKAIQELSAKADAQAAEMIALKVKVDAQAAEIAALKAK